MITAGDNAATAAAIAEQCGILQQETGTSAEEGSQNGSTRGRPAGAQQPKIFNNI